MPPILSVAPGMAIPGPWWLFELLLIVALTAHLLVVNVALGGTLLAVLAPGRSRDAALALAKRLPASVAVGVNLAIPPLLFASVLYGQYLYTAAIVSAVPWLSLFMVVMLAYALLYVFQPRAGRPGSGLAAAGAAVLLLAASLILVNTAILSLRPELWQAYFEHPGGTVLAVSDPTFVPRWLHFVTASLAVGGLYLALFSRRAARTDAEAAARVRTGLRWFTWATLAQIPIGLWFLLSLPRGIMERFFGLHSETTMAFMLGLGLAAAALLNAFRGRPGRAAFFTVATVGCMVVVRSLVRGAYLAPQFAPESLAVSFQTGPLVMFLAAFAATAAAVIWCVASYRRTAKRG